MVCVPVRQPLEPQLRDDAIFADQRHHVRDRADRRDLHERRHPLLASVLRAERLHQLQRDADAREMFVGIVAVVPLRVDHRERGRQRAFRLVMIGDDQIDAELVRAPRRLGAADAAVHRHDDARALRVQAIDRRRLQAVAVAHPLGQEVDDIAAEQFDHAAQDDRGGHAVDVVVAVHRDALFPRDRAHQAIDGRREIGQQIRIVEVIERRREEA